MGYRSTIRKSKSLLLMKSRTKTNCFLRENDITCKRVKPKNSFTTWIPIVQRNFVRKLCCLYLYFYTRYVCVRKSIPKRKKNTYYIRKNSWTWTGTNLSNSYRINKTLDRFNKILECKTNFTELWCKIQNRINKILLYRININT